MADRAGQQLGNYQLIRLLGKGGYAYVYLGEHIHLGTFAAVKVLSSQLSTDDLEKFRKEARTLARLQHPHIVRVLEFGVENDTPYLIMDYAPNGTLRQRHPTGAILSMNTVVRYVKQIADALYYAHNQNVIHRDVKPENMLLGPKDEVLLSDFGIATIVQQSSQVSGTNSIVGTVSYMAPEQLQGKARPASDQYALGIIVYEWLTGSRPFQGMTTELIAQHLSVQPPPLRQKVPSIARNIEQAVLRALEKDPHQRFATINDFAHALEISLPSPGIPVTPIPPASRQPTPPPTVAGIVTGMLPAFPKSSASSVYWPTFSISEDERRAISSGKLPQEPLIAPGQILMTSPGPLPFTTLPAPPVKVRPPGQVVIQPTQPSPTYIPPGQMFQPIVLSPPAGSQSSGQIVRSIAPPSNQPVGVGATTSGTPSMTGYQGSPTTSKMPIVRSTGGSLTQAPGGTILSPVATQGNRLSWGSLLTALVSIAVFIIGDVAVSNYNTSYYGSPITQSYTAGNIWCAVIFFTTTLVAFVTAIIALNKQGVPPNARGRAIGAIVLCVVFVILEIAWLSVKH